MTSSGTSQKEIVVQLWQTGVYIHFPPAHNTRLQNKTKAASVNSASHGNNKGLARQQEGGVVCAGQRPVDDVAKVCETDK